MSRRLFYWINILVPLLFGIMVYLYWRPDAYISKLILNLFRISYAPERGRPAGVQRFIRYYLCDICWAYALTFSLAFWLGKDSLMEAYTISAVFALLVEILQLLPQTPGSFDILDIIVELSACTIAVLIIKSYEWGGMYYEKNE